MHGHGLVGILRLHLHRRIGELVLETELPHPVNERRATLLPQTKHPPNARRRRVGGVYGYRFSWFGGRRRRCRGRVMAAEAQRGGGIMVNLQQSSALMQNFCNLPHTFRILLHTLRIFESLD